MPAPTVTNTFTAGTPAVASQVNTNFSDILAWLTTNAIQKDASLAFTAIPSGPATDPTGANQLTRKSYVDTAIAGIVNITGNAGTATRWATGRTITLTGDVTGTSVAFTGLANLSFATAVGDDTHSHTSGTLPVLSSMAGSVTSAQIPATVTGKTSYGADRFLADTNGTVGTPSFAWTSDSNMGLWRGAWTTNIGHMFSVDGTTVFQVWRDSTSGDSHMAMNTNMEGVVGGTAVTMETISVNGTNVKRISFASSKTATKDAIEDWALNSEEWDALRPRSYVVKKKFAVGGKHVAYSDAKDVPVGAVPLRRYGLVYEETAAASLALVTEHAPDDHALIAALIAEVKSLRARVTALEAVVS